MSGSVFFKREKKKEKKYLEKWVFLKKNLKNMWKKRKKLYINEIKKK